uniref:MRG domain-containing protein n=1 Tax=Cavia porcellus TaxID=10141 RepID=A0A286XGN0_CAVPO
MPKFQETKCVKVVIKDKQVKYFKYYSGWNLKSTMRPRHSENTLKTHEDIVALFPVPEGAPSVHHLLLTSSWDKWVPESRVFKYVDTNLQKLRELQKANEEDCSRKEDSDLQKKNVDMKTKMNKLKTPGNGDGGSTSETPQTPQKKRARVSEDLKPWLVNDWDLITRQKQLFYLRAKNVYSILEDCAIYEKSCGNTDNNEYAVNEVVAGIKEYFKLLYKFERPQYAEILADYPEVPKSQVYGAPQLLRLFKSLALLLNYLHDFLKYLVKNLATLFSTSYYEVPPPQYYQNVV